MEKTNNRTIARNTLMLYGRAILMMMIGLYTSRVILNTLGVSDFGIYNAVGGIIAMFGIISSSLSNATSRTITVAIGKGDIRQIKAAFGNLKVVYYIMCFFVVLLGETIGLWFLYHKMSIPADRMDAAFWVLQFTIFTTVLNFICVPYNSAIIAHERMSAFAYISLMDVILKLLICFSLSIIPYDKLIIYGMLMVGVCIIDRIIYVVYCNKRFPEVHAKPRINKEQIKDILSISGWTLSGNFAWILNTQGINLILNVFFGPIVNAARGIALQVQGVMAQFVTNFQTAINPQITKSYAQSNFQRMHELLNMSSKFSYLLMLVMSIPVLVEAPVILKFWLNHVPEHTIVYLRIILIYSILTTLSNPLWVSVLATGQLKKYQIYDNVIQLLVIPISYLVFKYLQADSYWVFVILLISEILEIFIRVWIVLPLIHHQYSRYIREVILPIIGVTVTAPIIPLLLNGLIGQEFYNFIFVCIFSVLCSLVSIWLFALNHHERSWIQNFAKEKILNYKK